MQGGTEMITSVLTDLEKQASLLKDLEGRGGVVKEMRKKECSRPREQHVQRP